MIKHSDVTKPRKPSAVRDRLLFAAAQLLHEAEGKEVSTRAICELAGVQAPTLYHYFGNKQGLLDAVVNYGFTQYVHANRQSAGSGDPIAEIRTGWDSHVQFGLEHPSFYVRLYGQIQPGVPCALTAIAEAMLLELLGAVARQGRLRVAPVDAATQIVAANVGVTLRLIAQPEGKGDLGLSERVRDAILSAILTGPPEAETTASCAATMQSVATAAIALFATLDQAETTLSAGETGLLREWLRRLTAG